MSVITAADIERASGVLSVQARDIVTPLALDRAKELGIRIERANAPIAPKADNTRPPAPAARSVPVAPASPRPAQARAPDPLSGALYRRGLQIPPQLAVRDSEPRSTPLADDRTSVADERPSVAVIGAGHVGAMTALRLAETSLFARVTLIDIVPGLAEGLALDMWHSAGLRRFTTRVAGSTDMAALAGASFVVMTAGRPRQPGMSRTDLTGVNAEIVGSVADAIRERAPGAVVVVVTNPLEEMTHLMARRTGFPPARIIGMAGVLDSARFCSLVGLAGIAQPQDVRALALGSHGAEMVIPLSLATANGQPIETLIDAATLAGIVERARNSGAEVVKLLQKGSAYFSPAESAASMVAAMASGQSDVIAACVQSNGAYDLVDTRIGLPVRLGPQGVREIVRLPLRADEQAALQAAATSIAGRIAELG